MLSLTLRIACTCVASVYFAFSAKVGLKFGIRRISVSGQRGSDDRLRRGGGVQSLSWSKV